MAHGSRKFFASGSLLANANLLLPLWVSVVLFTGEFFVRLVSLIPGFDLLIGQRLDIAFEVLIPSAVLLWFAHRYGLQPRLIDPFRLGRYYTGHGLIALTTLTIISVFTIPYASAALGHTVDFGMWFFFFQMPSLLFGLFTYGIGAALIWNSEDKEPLPNPELSRPSQHRKH
jgi:hypothetical protein